MLTGIAGDFNADGYDDLAIGVPLEDVAANAGEIVDAGGVSVIYGSPSGLTASADQWFDQASPDMHGTAQPHDRFGFALAAGDFNDDGIDDLAVGVPYEDVDGERDAGAVQVIYGSGAGLAPAGEINSIPENQLWYQDVIENQGGGSEAGDRFGFALAVGDFDGDGVDDLAIGAPGEAVSGVRFAGAVTILFGSPAMGLVGTGAQQLYQGSSPNGSVVKGSAESGDNFGFALAAGRFNDDLRDDLAVGVPFEDVSVATDDSTIVEGTDSGAVNILYGSPTGLTGDGDQLIVQSDLGSSLDDGDRFGYSLAAGNFDSGTGQDDLAIGVPYEDHNEGPIVDSGAVHVIFGSADGLDLSTAVVLESPALEQDALFGYSLAAGEFGEGAEGMLFSPEDLAIGAPWDTVGGVAAAGAVYVAYVSDGEMVMSASPFAQGLLDISGVAEPDDLFGYSLVAGDFGTGHQADLAVGVPLENIGDTVNAGAVHVIYGGAFGLGFGGNELWHQASGLLDAVEPGDSFGCGLTGGSLGEGTRSCLRTIESEAPELPTSPQVQDEPNPEPLTAAEIANMEKYIAHELDDNIAGYQFAIAQNGVLLEEISRGAARLDLDDDDDSLAMSNDLRIDLGSISKVITAVTVLKLVDDGLIELNFPFYTYLDPARFDADQIDATVKQITVLELLTQTSGLVSAGGSEYDLEAARSVLAQPRQMYNCFDFAASGWPAPPSRCLRDYNNWNFSLLRYVIEGAILLEVTDDPVENAALYNQFVREYWIESIDPNDDQPAACLAAPPMSYYKVADGALAENVVESEEDPPKVCGAGGWRASAEDMIDILGGIRSGLALSPAMTCLNLLLDVTLADASLTPGTTGLGFEPPWGGSLNLGKDGGIPDKMRTYMTRLPENVDAVLLTNTNGVPIEPTVESTSPVTVLRDAYANKDPEVIVFGAKTDDDIVVRLNADEPDFLEVLVNDTPTVYRLASTVETLTIFLTLGGDDHVAVESLPAGIHVVINGTDGDDRITLERLPAGVDAVIGGFIGDDRVNIGGGDLDPIIGPITVAGGDDHDVVVLDDQDDTGNDAYGFAANVFSKGFHVFAIKLDSIFELQLEANAGNNTIGVASLIDLTPLDVRGNDGDDSVTITTTEGIRAAGGNGNDTLAGWLGDDVLDGGPDHDWLTGSYGHDTLTGGPGNDNLHGGAGNDSLFGDQGIDLLFGDEDDDRLRGGTEEDFLRGGSGNDEADGDEGIDLIDGDDGNDKLSGSEGDDTINGGAGNDSLFGQAGEDTLVGGAGNDSLSGDGGEDDSADLLYGGFGDDTLEGGQGSDSLYGEEGDDRLIGGVHMASPPKEILDLSADLLDGGPGSDAILGDNGDFFFLLFSDDFGGPDQIFGGPGNDTVYAQGGGDDVYGNSGNDSITGGAGNDTILGGSYIHPFDPPPADGDDIIHGGDGSDSIYGDNFDPLLPPTISLNGGDDELFGGDGNDTVFGQAGHDELDGGRDDDTLHGGVGNDELRGGPGTDLLVGDSGTDLLFGDDGSDTLDGGADDDILVGGSGNDDLLGQGGDDFANGEEGADRVVGGPGDDQLFGGEGADVLIGGNQSLVADLGVDSLDGEGGDDLILGDSGTSNPLNTSSLFGGADTIQGGPGNDTIYAMAAGDFVGGGLGDDVIFCGIGNDVASGDAGHDNVAGESGNDLVAGGEGDDTVTGGSGNDLLVGGWYSAGAMVASETGDDQLNGGGGQDTLFGDSWAQGAPLDLGVVGGDDMLRGGSGDDLVVGQTGDDSLFGDTGDDMLLGAAGNDIVRGGGGDDQLGGGAGDDLLLGEGDDDTLTGGDGRDVLIGGLGADTLDGGAGDDILIADTTNYDNDDAALNLILAEWTSPHTYQSRVKNLKGTGKGLDFDNRLNGNVFLKKNGPAATVFDDAAIDNLTGSTGEDWFLYDQPLDVLVDWVGGENKN